LPSAPGESRGTDQTGDASLTARDLAPSQSAAALEEYLAPWEAYVPREIIGGFLSVLGDDEAVLELAARYLGQRKVEDVRQLLAWTPIDMIILGRKVVGYGEDIHTAMAKQRFVVEIVSPDAVDATNLLGEPLVATASTRYHDLLLGSS